MKIKEVFKSQRVAKITILVVTLLIVCGLVKMIYFYDQPKFIPEETRGKVREGVNEDVVKPIGQISPSLAKAIQKAAYQNPSSGGIQPYSNSGSSGTTNTSTWQTYRNEKYGYEMKYPDGYTVDISGNAVSINPSGDMQKGLWVYENSTSLNLINWWQTEKQKYSAQFTDTAVVINDQSFIKSYSREGLGETHYVTVVNGKAFDFLLIGPSDLEKIIETLKF